MIAMKNSKDILNNAIEEVSEKELMEVAGGKRGTGGLQLLLMTVQTQYSFVVNQNNLDKWTKNFLFRLSLGRIFE